MPSRHELWESYRLRLKRKHFLWRALRKRHQLDSVTNRTGKIRPCAILAFAVMRNEARRLPFFLKHYRKLGVDHFLIVDNGSTDDTAALLAEARDVSLWQTAGSYRASRFGLDWVTWLMLRYGHDRWCLTVDADELLIYPYHDSRPLPALTDWLDRSEQRCFPAMMLDLYPKGPLGAQRYEAGQDPRKILRWFDAGNYMMTRQDRTDALWIQGGPRARAFFAHNPRQAPTLSKIPLVRWHRRWAYLNSTHALLPRHLNQTYDTEGGEAISGLLLHTKFLDEIVDKSKEEKSRGEHFGQPAEFDQYYDALAADPELWTPHSTRLGDWRQLEAQGLMSRGGWM
ncbi:glycosyl transferase family 2 [Thioclava sp. NG1]|uniref:glycosyltransferase family 2 protein n=1 Tax=Thioclava sp. NG1 TaxID=2182426 RepID=UPI000D616A7B|nr:glycosyltransferase family 2 protein [Thioclava sp. NG1]PWE50183.1 glycosyl transferase family 2 [Thioclava sp. NG1]